MPGRLRIVGEAAGPATVRSSSAFRVILALGGLLAASPAIGADLSPASASSEPIRLGTITGDRVRIRTGPSLNHFPVGMLRRGNGVLVRRELGDWFEIDVPSWIPVYVHAAYVEFPDGAPIPVPAEPGNADSPERGGTVVEKTPAAAEHESTKPAAPGRVSFRQPCRGRVVADRLVIRALAARKHEPVGMVNRGVETSVLGRDGDWLRIRPPLAASAWVHKSLVRLGAGVSAGRLAALRQSLGAETELSNVPEASFGASKPAPADDGGVNNDGGTVVAGTADEGTSSPKASAVGKGASDIPGASSAAGANWRRLKDLLRSGDPLGAPETAATLREIRAAFQEVLDTRLGDDSLAVAERGQASDGLRMLDLLDKRAVALRDAKRLLEELNNAERELRLRLAKQKTSIRTRKGTVGNNQNNQTGRRDRFSETGRLARVGAAPGRQGTHLLRNDGKVSCLLVDSKRDDSSDADSNETDGSDADDRGRALLDAFLDENVQVQGVVIGLDESSGLKLVEVSSVKRAARR